ncbi:MAG: Gfo/Idh/MocA family oxidoreductase [Bryobacteraceae bacterium]|nr:Gfo/Idh/MocA family oxidoreductase [Bryobacteraceae bacterium]
MKKICWGVLGAAKIAVEKVIPAMQRSDLTEVTALASRDREKGARAAAKLGIPKVYGSYEELLADPEIDAIYNPLPNHLHVPWSIKAAEAGKHVLCEKPVALSAGEARALLAARSRYGVKIGEAFMARSNPQWLRAREIVQSGAIGPLRVVVGFFSYFNRDPNNVRNKPEWGGGALMDIGCYPVTLSRLLYGEEPVRVMGLIERDPDFGIDRLTSAMLEYPSGQCLFNCSMQLVPYQRMQLLGTKGRVEVEIPFNAPPDRPNRLLIDDGSSVHGDGIRVEELPVANQYTIQGDLFSRAILEGGPEPTTLEDAVQNMAVLEAIFRSAESGRWEKP